MIRILASFGYSLNGVDTLIQQKGTYQAGELDEKIIDIAGQIGLLEIVESGTTPDKPAKRTRKKKEPAND